VPIRIRPVGVDIKIWGVGGRYQDIED